jgi:tripartite-type tricarboxylate transporter receptor subunit TctC
VHVLLEHPGIVYAVVWDPIGTMLISGVTDTFARLIAQKLSEQLGARFFVENITGASGNLGTGQVAKAAPDGYTLTLGSTGTLSTAPPLYPRLGYDPVKDFAMTSLVNNVPLVLEMHPSIPAKTMKEFIALAKSRPGKMTYGSSGNGSSNHMTGAMLMSAAQLDMVHVPYKGGGPGMVALLGGEIDMMVAQIPSSRQLLSTGWCTSIAANGSAEPSGHLSANESATATVAASVVDPTIRRSRR